VIGLAVTRKASRRAAPEEEERRRRRRNEPLQDLPVIDTVISHLVPEQSIEVSPAASKSSSSVQAADETAKTALASGYLADIVSEPQVTVDHRATPINTDISRFVTERSIALCLLDPIRSSLPRGTPFHPIALNLLRSSLLKLEFTF
jgi:hypothetical protein